MHTRNVLSSIIAVLLILLVGCDSNDSAEDEVAGIRMLPESATMSIGDTTDFAIFEETVAGELNENADLDVRWWSTDTTVFTVDASGTAIATGEGTAFCMAETITEGVAAKVAFVGRDSAFVTVLF